MPSGGVKDANARAETARVSTNVRKRVRRYRCCAGFARRGRERRREEQRRNDSTSFGGCDRMRRGYSGAVFDLLSAEKDASAGSA